MPAARSRSVSASPMAAAGVRMPARSGNSSKARQSPDWPSITAVAW
ncbi:Uncharacterised protein [Mycobacteroides abscessus subsp. abscessus]|nr:Uncharacterised protein [Mycobacteroides abscessus subsp. abscessus]